MSADQLAINSSASTVSDQTWSAMAVDSRLNVMVTAVDQWGTALQKRAGRKQEGVHQRLRPAKSYWQAPMDKDLYDLASKINGKVTDTTSGLVEPP